MKLEGWFNEFSEVIKAVEKLGDIISIETNTIIFERDGQRGKVNYYTGKQKKEYYVKEN